MKSAYYTAVVTNAYRAAIDGYEKLGDDYTFDSRWMRELESVSHREYGTGYFYGAPCDDANTTSSLGYIRDKAYLAVATGAERDGKYQFRQKNKLSAGEYVEIVSPGKFGRGFTAEKIFDENGAEIESVPHPDMKFFLSVPFEVTEGDILRGGK